MLKNKRQNFHHSKLPELGTIAKLPKELGGGKCIVESFPLCDNVLPYSLGIHTVNVRMLHNNQVKTFSGFWLMDDQNN